MLPYTSIEKPQKRTLPTWHSTTGSTQIRVNHVSPKHIADASYTVLYEIRTLYFYILHVRKSTSRNFEINREILETRHEVGDGRGSEKWSGMKISW